MGRERSRQAHSAATQFPGRSLGPVSLGGRGIEREVSHRGQWVLEFRDFPYSSENRES